MPSEKTRAIYLESLNPSLRPDLKPSPRSQRTRKSSNRGQYRSEPRLVQPLKHGADIVVNSLTKYIGGMERPSGAIVDGGARLTSGKFAEFTERTQGTTAWFYQRPLDRSPLS